MGLCLSLDMSMTRTGLRACLRCGLPRAEDQPETRLRRLVLGFSPIAGHSVSISVHVHLALAALIVASRRGLS